MEVPHVFRPLSGLDWCEWNYRHSYLVAEFANTISNLPILAASIVGLHMNKDYLNKVNDDVRYVYYLMFLVGAASAYYHATLSLFGQLLDELALLWVATASFVVWIPSMTCVPPKLRAHTGVMQRGALVIAALGTGLCAIQPRLNAYVLISLCGPGLCIMTAETRRRQHKGLALRVGTMWAVAITIWLADRLLCSYWTSLGFPYLHAFWHMCSAMASHRSVVTFSFFDAEKKVPELEPEIKSASILGFKISYVAIKQPNAPPPL